MNTATDASPARSYGDSRFWDKLAAKYATRPVGDEDAYEYKLGKTQEHLRPDTTVLEIACGSGTTAIKHSSFVKHIRAIDFSAEMIAIARGKAKASGISNIDFEHCSIDDLDAADGPYDVVMANSILHLVRDKDAVLARLSASLRPGGVFVSSTVCVADSFPLLGLVAPIGRMLGVLPFISSFTRDQLTAAIERVGFSIDHVWKPDVGSSVFIIALKPENG